MNDQISSQWARKLFEEHQASRAKIKRISPPPKPLTRIERLVGRINGIRYRFGCWIAGLDPDAPD